LITILDKKSQNALWLCVVNTPKPPAKAI